MKPQFVLLILCMCSLFACKQKRNNEDIANYTYNPEIKLNDTLQNRVGDWITEEMECYGLVVAKFSNNQITVAKPVKAKVLIIRSDMIKMKALETVNVGINKKMKACGKLQIEKGETWWEKEGDLFRTKKEASTYANKLNDSAKSHKFTID